MYKIKNNKRILGILLLSIKYNTRQFHGKNDIVASDRLKLDSQFNWTRHVGQECKNFIDNSSNKKAFFPVPLNK